MAEEIILQTSFSSVLGKLKPFSGKESFRTFITNFELRSNIEQWNLDTKQKLLNFLCIEEARLYSNANPESKTLDYDDLKKYLELRFVNNISKLEAYRAFTNIKQKNLTVKEYIAEIDIIIDKYLEILTELQEIGTRDQFLISTFLNGLQLDIKQIIIVRDFKTYNEIINCALKIEETLPKKRI